MPSFILKKTFAPDKRTSSLPAIVASEEKKNVEVEIEYDSSGEEIEVETKPSSVAASAPPTKSKLKKGGSEKGISMRSNHSSRSDFY